jgi:nitroreductase
MEIIGAIKKRRSVRKFDEAKKVTDKQIETLLEAARWAPSAGNLQSYLIVVVQKKRIKEKLAEIANGQDFVAKASVVFVVCGDGKRSASRYGTRGENFYSIQDATLAAYSLWLTAVEMGLAGCWVGAFNEESVIKILGLEKNFRPVAILPVGYPAESPTPPSRRSVSEISKKL